MPVIPAAGTVPLASVSDFATYLQRDLDAEDTATAELLLDLASAEIRTYTGQYISAVVDDTITLDPPCWSSRLFLPQLPVTGVTSVTVAGSLWALTTDYVWYGDTGMIEFVSRWPESVRRSVVVVYSHGYAAGSPELGVAQGVCLALAKGALTSAGIDVKSESIGNYSVTYEAVRSELWSEESAGLRSSLGTLRPLVVA